MRSTAWSAFALPLTSLLAVSVGVGCVSKSKYESTLSQLKQCQGEQQACSADRDKAQADLAAMTSERDKERAGRGDAEKQLASLGADMTTTKKELEELRRQNELTQKRLEAFRNLTARFQKMIDAGRIQVLIRNGQMIMKLPAGILFRSGRADLSAEGQAAITEVAGIIKELTDRNFLVAGHTDNVPVPRRGQFKDNWDLSTARAVTVVKYLVQQGVSPKNLVAAGYGEHDPVGDNSTDPGRQENRRIEIVLLPNIEELPQMPPDAGAPASQPS